ncbi:MAG: glycosyltransferase family 4 protein [Gammaproteobacteria bacterium]|nr:glycosyltransferase family 4 protein [Gammaproteobacteria bacterium]
MLLENHSYPADVRVRSEAEALVRSGYHVKVIAPRAPGQPRAQSIEGVEVSRYRLPRERAGATGLLAEYLVANLQLYVRGFGELLRGARVVHLHNPPDTLFGVAWAARLLGGRVVFDHHDLAPELFAAKFGTRPRIALRALRFMERRTMRSASHVLAANESHRAVAIHRGGVTPAAVTVVRNGPRVGALSDSPPRTGMLREPRLVFVGSMAVQDGVEELADIIRELNQRHGIRAQLTVVGDGPSRAALAARARELAVDSRVQFTGQVAPDQVPALLAEADICLDPAPCNPLNHCSTMVKVAEYLAAGRPVVAYRLRETVHTAGAVALLAACGNRSGFVANVARLAGDGNLRAELGRRGRERARELAWEQSEQALIGAYARL